MKKFFNWITNKWKATYLIWVLLHFVLFFFAAHPFSRVTGRLYARSRAGNVEFFPFGRSLGTLKDTWYYQYDYTEFIFYLIVPIIIAMIVYFFRKGNKND